MGRLAKNINRWKTEKEIEISPTCDKENIHIKYGKCKLRELGDSIVRP